MVHRTAGGHTSRDRAWCMHGAYLGGMGVLLVAPLPALLSDCRPPSSHITRQEALPAAGFVAMDASLLATGAGGTKLDVQAQAMTLSHWLLVKQLGQGNHLQEEFAQP